MSSFSSSFPPSPPPSTTTTPPRPPTHTTRPLLPLLVLFVLFVLLVILPPRSLLLRLVLYYCFSAVTTTSRPTNPTPPISEFAGFIFLNVNFSQKYLFNLLDLFLVNCYMTFYDRIRIRKI